MRVLQYGDIGMGIQAPAPSPLFQTTDIPDAVPRLIATARASLSPETADWLAELVGPDEIDVRAGPSRVLRLWIGRDSVEVFLFDADATRLFTASPRFSDGTVRRVLTVPWRGKRRSLVRALQRLGGEVIAFSINDRAELQLAFGPNMLHVEVVGPSFAELAERGGLFVKRENPTSGEVGLSEGSALERLNRQIDNGNARFQY